MSRFIGRCCAGVGTYLAADTETQANNATAEAEAAASSVEDSVEAEVATEQSLNVGMPQQGGIPAPILTNLPSNIPSTGSSSMEQLLTLASGWTPIQRRAFLEKAKTAEPAAEATLLHMMQAAGLEVAPSSALTAISTTIPWDQIATPPKQDMRPVLIGGGLLLALLMLK